MPRRKFVIDEKALSKGELRKLNALRKSIGPELAEDAFAKWYQQKDTGTSVGDPNVEVIETALGKVIDKLRFPRGGGYQVRRGRGRIIVEPLN